MDLFKTSLSPEFLEARRVVILEALESVMSRGGDLDRHEPNYSPEVHKWARTRAIHNHSLSATKEREKKRRYRERVRARQASDLVQGSEPSNPTQENP